MPILKSLLSLWKTKKYYWEAKNPKLWAAISSDASTVIRFLWVIAKFVTCTVVSVNGTLVEVKMFTFTLESSHFIFSKCPICTQDGASVKFSINSQQTDYSEEQTGKQKRTESRNDRTFLTIGKPERSERTGMIAASIRWFTDLLPIALVLL
jgi:hypothetical protein